jgi:thiol-disulfide isomerase/thioredoxin
VSVQLVPSVRDRYYFRPDATPAEANEAAKLPALFSQAVATLRDAKLSQPAAAAVPRQGAAGAAPRERSLRPYQGNPAPAALRLASLDGTTRDLADYRGQVVLINFWASWCPPCVHEMPSMQRLKEKLAGRPFTILAVNMAEDEGAIRAFLKEKVTVDFPILLDRDGAALKRWKVFAFPTTFVVGADGTLRYGLVGEAEWDSTPIVRALEALLPK